MTRVATCVESAGRSIASRISGNAGSTVSIPSAVSAVAIEMVMVNGEVVFDGAVTERRPGQLVGR